MATFCEERHKLRNHPRCRSSLSMCTTLRGSLTSLCTVLMQNTIKSSPLLLSAPANQQLSQRINQTKPFGGGSIRIPFSTYAENNHRQGDSQFQVSETLKAHFYFTYFWLASILTVLKEEAIKLDFITDRSTYLQRGIKTPQGLKKWHKRSVSVNELQQTSWALFRLESDIANEEVYERDILEWPLQNVLVLH